MVFRSQFSSSIYISGQSRIGFLSHPKIMPLLLNSSCLPHRELDTSQQHSQADKKRRSIRLRQLQRRLFILVRTLTSSYRQSSAVDPALWYGSQMSIQISNKLQLGLKLKRLHLDQCKKTHHFCSSSVLGVHIYMFMGKNKEAIYSSKSGLKSVWPYRSITKYYMTLYELFNLSEP